MILNVKMLIIINTNKIFENFNYNKKNIISFLLSILQYCKY